MLNIIEILSIMIVDPHPRGVGEGSRNKGKSVFLLDVVVLRVEDSCQTKLKESLLLCQDLKLPPEN